MAGVDSQPRFPLRVAEEEDRKYTVERILDSRRNRNGSLEYLIEWTGYEETTWEPATNLRHLRKVVRDFEKSTEQSRPGKKQRSS